MGLEKFRIQLNKVRTLPVIVNKVFRQVLREQADFIAELNRRQLSDGQRPDGSSLPDYVEGSRQPSAPGPLTLFETGEFYEGLEPIFSENQFRITSSDVKTVFLQGKYRPIFGLTPQNLNILRQRIKPIALQRLKAQL